MADENGQSKYAQFYGTDDRPFTRFLSDNEDTSPARSLLVKAAIGIGAAAVLHRTGALRQAARFIGTEGKGSLMALRETLDHEGTLLQDLSSTRLDRMRRSFLDRRRRIVDDRKQRLNDFSSAREYDLQRYIRQVNQNVKELVPYGIQSELRHRDVMLELGQLAGREDAHRVREAFKVGNLDDMDFLHNFSDEQFRGLLRQQGIEDNLIQLAEQARGVHRNTVYKDSSEYKAAVSRMQDKLTTKAAENAGGVVRKEWAHKKYIRGQRQATVEDVLAMHSSGRINLDDATRVDLEHMIKRSSDFRKQIFDSNLFVKEDAAGNIVDYTDYKVFDEMMHGLKKKAANTVPGGLMHLRDQLNIREAREIGSFRVVRRGTRHQSLQAQMGQDINSTLDQNLVYINGDFVPLYDVAAINDPLKELTVLNQKRKMFATSSRFGTIAKLHRSTGGLMTTQEDKRGAIRKLFDIGKQDKDAVGPKLLSQVTKLWSPEWERNIMTEAMNRGVDEESLRSMRGYFDKYTQELSPRVLNRIRTYLPGNIQQFLDDNEISFSNEEHIMKLFRFMGEATDIPGDTAIKRTWRNYSRDPDSFLAAKRPIGESNLILGEHTRIQTGQDKIKRDVSMELIRQITAPNSTSPRNLNLRKVFNDLYEGRHIHTDEAENANFLLNYHFLREAGGDAYGNPTAAVDEVNHMILGQGAFSSQFRSDVMKAVKRNNPIYEKFTGQKPPNTVNDEFLYVNKAINGWEGIGTIKDIAKQLSWTTGRRNMEDVTTLSIFGGQYPWFRLQDALGDWGLGFSDDSLSSPLKMVSSLFLKRFLPLYGAYEGYQYADYEVDKHTGMGITARWQNMRARSDLSAAFTRDAMGTNEGLAHRQMLHPGIEHFAAMPDWYLPGVGEFGPGHVLGALFAPGTPIDEKDTFTGEEYQNYLQNGVEEVRKGRWWLWGSKTAFRGDRISEFRPNDWRLAMSDWEYSNTSLTGEERYGEMNILPTFENPLGIFKRMLDGNEYYWEQKHYYDRPYMMTGSLFNPNTMFFGDIGNATIGQLVKPSRRMHPDYWGDPVLIEQENEGLGNRPTEPVVTRVSPAGRTEDVVYAGPTSYGAPYSGKWAGTGDVNPGAVAAPVKYFVSSELDEQGNQTGAYVAQDITSGQAMYVPANIAKEGYSMDRMFAMAGTDEPMVETKPRAMHAEEYAYRNEVRNRKLREMKDPSSINWRLQESAQNWAEPLGVYKWIADEVAGDDPYTGNMVIQKADAANNLSNRFWGMNLGSVGGPISEIGRRFIRADDGQLDEYNPIRNTMPDWLPGGDYFINFQVGDPYTKVAHGDYRLPGDAYEKLNPLHPDQTGRYGSFDKFKILADVAPWSDEYKFWRDYVVDNETDPEVRKQAAEIKRQVAKRKQKYDFTEYRFKYAELEKEQVTVTKMLDDYTFLTKEYGDTPIRLAGMDYKPAAHGVLDSYIGVGDKVTVGINADQSQRISDDQYGTMRAVVFDGLKNINQDILRRGLMKENLTDFSAPSVFARFTPDEIAEGTRWESIAHYESPLNTKFLQVRTALEEYERDQVYGKDWATWRNFLTSDYLIPGFQSAFRHDTLESMMRGGITGGVIMGVLGGGGSKRVAAGAIIGALVGGLGHGYARHYEYTHNGETWIPERRRKENEINEYFDLLKYMKYSGLYEATKREAEASGYDVDGFINDIEQKQANTKERRQQLNEEKRQLYLKQPDGWVDRRKAINQELNDMQEGGWDEIMLPDIVRQALQYKEQSEETLYAIDPYDDRMKVARAFPTKDKWFFDDFVNAPERDRERILQLVPENERRIYKALWDYGDEYVPPLEDYFQKYALPDANWAGWRPDFDLESIKLKVVQNQKLDLSDFNFWPDDVEASRMTPNLTNQGNNMYQQSDFSYKRMERNIQDVLQGQGLKNVNVTVTPSSGAATRVGVQYEQDRSGEIDNYLRNNMGSLM
ncbi:hypothetical protein SAMN02799624_05435 [Paenibacillus sp. UNC496MF]|nr:hypothetical protein SAMN02799624_05435 [Paenibacillus sp. UNC496MF]